MAKLHGTATVELNTAFVFEEDELRALDALVGYGDDAFIKHFYEKLGTAYMKPHEAGLRKLFQSIREQAPHILKRADEARHVFEGRKVAHPSSPVLSRPKPGEGRAEVDLAREPGFGFKLSDQAKADIDEMTRPPSAASIAAISNQIIGASDENNATPLSASADVGEKHDG